MSTVYADPFCQAIEQVFKLMLDVEVFSCSSDAGLACANEQEVAVVVELTGDIEGVVLFRFPQSTTLKIVKLMCGMEIDQLDAFVTSAMAEMSNIISGNAVTNLSQENYHCDIKPPQIMIGDRDKLPLHLKSSIPLQSAVGYIQIDMSLSKNR